MKLTDKSAKQEPASESSVERGMAFASCGWNLRLVLLLGEIENGLRFTDFLVLKGLSRRVLAERMVELQGRGIVCSVPYCKRPLRHRYQLTDRGKWLYRNLVDMLDIAGGGAPAIAEFVEADAIGSEHSVGRHSFNRTNPTLEDNQQPVEGIEHPVEQLLAGDPTAAREVWQQTLGDVHRYDKRYRSSLIETLIAYLNANASISVAAARLYVHRHTVRYRLGRIHELSGLDVDNVHDRERLVLALRARRVLGE